MIDPSTNDNRPQDGGFSCSDPQFGHSVIFESGGTGEADLYVKYGSTPTTSSYDCRPYKTGNSESCPIANARGGTYYVMVRAYASYTGVTPTGSYNP